jgi:hypothetical protein
LILSATRAIGVFSSKWITSDLPVMLPQWQRQTEKGKERRQRAARLLRETRFIDNGFVARVKAVGVVYWSAFTSACLFHSELQAHIVLPLQAYLGLYPLEL